ncbi:MAG: N-acetyl-gamma-glutamyl-phosphate reductase [Solirubrobacterales bacterium]
MAEAVQPIGTDGARSRVVVAGATGYAGALAAHLVWNHPALELVEITSRSEIGTRLNDLYPRYDVPFELKELDLAGLEDVDVGIVAYPHGAAAPVVAEMRGLGMLVVDLSADFRLEDLPTYERFYGKHGNPELLDGAVYGLTELERSAVADAELVANPGCYPTASILALAPLAEAGLIDDVVIDAKSGVSGAGRGGGEATSFITITENVSPYKTVAHRHRPEILEQLNGLSPADIPSLTFVPHLVPVDQGELVSCYVRSSVDLVQEDLDKLYEARYLSEPFVKVVGSAPGMRDVRDTNQCQIQVVAGDDRILVFAAIDNLWKGSSGQAIQNLNLILGLDEGLGLK